MGFDKVSLLDILFTNPGGGQGFEAFLNSAGNADNAYSTAEENGVFKYRLNNESFCLDFVGHYIFSKGSVKKDGTNEFLDGSKKTFVKKESKLNPFKKGKDVINNHKTMEETFNRISIAKNYLFNKLNDEKIMALRMQVSPINLKDGSILYLFLNQL